MRIQETLDGSNPVPLQFKRKAVCLNCKTSLPNNHWSFCSYYCKNMFSNKKVKYLNGESISKGMKLGQAFGSEFESLPQIEAGQKLTITKTEFGTTEKGKYPFVIITDRKLGQLFTTKSAIVKTLQRQEVIDVLASGEVIETEAIVRTSNTGREGLVLRL